MIGLERIESVLHQKDRVAYGRVQPSNLGGASAQAEGVGYLYPETQTDDLTHAETTLNPPEVPAPHCPRRFCGRRCAA